MKFLNTFLKTKKHDNSDKKKEEELVKIKKNIRNCLKLLKILNRYNDFPRKCEYKIKRGMKELMEYIEWKDSDLTKLNEVKELMELTYKMKMEVMKMTQMTLVNKMRELLIGEVMQFYK